MSSNRTASQDSSRLGSGPLTNSSSTIKARNRNAALRGATLAFGKPPVKPKPQIHNYSGNNGALAAATSVGGTITGGSRQSTRNINASRSEDLGGDQRLAYQNTGSSVGSRSYTGGPDRNMVQQRQSQLGARNIYLQPPGTPADQSRSASFIAATIAASRSASISPNITGQQESSTAKLRRPGNSRTPSVRSINSSRSSDHALDTTPIPPTTSLIGMFEQNAASTSTEKRPTARRPASGPPTKASRINGSPSPMRNRTPSPLANKPRKPPVKSTKPTLATIQSVSGESEPRKPPPTGRKPSLPITTPIPIPIPNKPKLPEVATALDDDDAASDDSFVSVSDYQPSDYQPSWRAEIAAQNRRLQSQSHANHSNPSVTVNSLANAIVASSLASSRAASPSKSYASSLHPPPPPPRRGNRGGLFHHSAKENDPSRTPSPAKPAVLRTTMRKPKSKEEIDEGLQRRGKKKFVKKHPNKHHEGDRKRWRDAITERERKRYEAVWASNRGLFGSGLPGDEDSVPSVAVRDIFSRSRLHDDVLEEAYELVDRGKNGRLEREEFVVGLWLIDQRLKGRKLPIRVSDSVWKSAGGMSGLKVKKVKK
ncbi:Increased rDNA silencing protein [Cadophora gregata]|uniref:Increased rDNA silencing protein n=1 Tax=Cadophora gregata TaxID=51156 RepID=UPI0026DDC987|nr:Increased rDNA silencing protein [Cadophora gregata]KAK0124246.1 Increased rDNA silencing protein [Cadophora gregata]KAK0129901.1 Increased rDNA silencing protein [Cadophora gregata f. sp. sojae]